ncbi:MAG: hypothetical protein IT440_04980 [Phycisphaeraceae bacterium]|nr:hypothetical protein [Phycisphaeraceae bacterium]
MSKNPTSQPPESEPDPLAADASIEQQLDALLDQIEQVEPGLQQVVNRPKKTAPAKPEAKKPDAAAAKTSTPPAAAKPPAATPSPAATPKAQTQKPTTPATPPPPAAPKTPQAASTATPASAPAKQDDAWNPFDENALASAIDDVFTGKSQPPPPPPPSTSPSAPAPAPASKPSAPIKAIPDNDASWAPFDENTLAAALEDAYAGKNQPPPASPPPPSPATPAASAASEDLVGEDLAAQLQEILDESRTTETKPAAPAKPAPSVAPAKPASSPVNPTDITRNLNDVQGEADFIADINRLLSGDAEEEPASTAAPAPVAAKAVPPAAAEDDLAGAFQTVEDAVAEQEEADTSAPASQAEVDALFAGAAVEHVKSPDAQAGDPAKSADDLDLEGAFESPEQVQQEQLESFKMEAPAEASASQPRYGDDSQMKAQAAQKAKAKAAAAPPSDDDLEGAFESPEIVAAQHGQSGAAASDPQAALGTASAARSAGKQETAPSSAKAANAQASPVAAEEPAQAAQAAPSSGRSLSPMGLIRGARSLAGAWLMDWVTRFPYRLAQLCAMLNAPIARCSAGTRNLVGYVGLITLFWACVMIVGKAAATFLGGK